MVPTSRPWFASANCEPCADPLQPPLGLGTSSLRARTTWKRGPGLLALVISTLWLTGGWWTVAIARSLVCEAS